MVKILPLLKENFVILFNAGSLIGTTVVTSALGFVYWWLAARLFPPQAVGFGSAAISAMTLFGTVCMLGLGTLLTGELPRQPGKAGELLSAALILVGVVGGIVGVLLAVAAPFIAKDFQPLSASIENILIFAAGVSLSAVTLVLDQALIGLLRGDLQLWRNTLFALIKLVALFAVGLGLANHIGLASHTGMSIYATWLLGNVLSTLALLAFALWKTRGPGKMYLPEWALLRQLRVAAMQHHILNLILLAPILLLPVMVTVELSATANAWFYVSYMLANFIWGVPNALSTALYAASSARPEVLAHKLRLTMGISTVIGVMATIVILFGGKLILSVFGHIYADQAIWCLRILSLGIFPTIIKGHFIAICRIKNQLGQVMVPIAIITFLELVFSAIGGHFAGLTGLSLGWLVLLIAQCFYMIPTVYKAAHMSKAAVDPRSVGIDPGVVDLEDDPLPAQVEPYNFLSSASNQGER